MAELSLFKATCWYCYHTPLDLTSMVLTLAIGGGGEHLGRLELAQKPPVADSPNEFKSKISNSNYYCAEEIITVSLKQQNSKRKTHTQLAYVLLFY